MAVKVHGVNTLLNELEAKFGQSKMESIVDDALTDGALVFGMELRRQLKTFSDGTGYSKGYTLDELTIDAPSPSGTGSRSVMVYWRGSHSRYRIIHLNEWGTIKNPNPRGKGKIAKAMKLSQRSYSKALRDSIRRNL